MGIRVYLHQLCIITWDVVIFILFNIQLMFIYSLDPSTEEEHVGHLNQQAN